MAETSLNPPSGTLAAPPAPALRAFGPFVLDLVRGELRRDGQPIVLRPRAFALLVFMASRPGELLSKDRLIAAVWPGVVVTDDSLTQCVHELRTALGDAGSALLRTVPRRGYRLEADVRSLHEPSAVPTQQGNAMPGPGGTGTASAAVSTGMSNGSPSSASGGPWALADAPRRSGLVRRAGPWVLVVVLAIAAIAWNGSRHEPGASPPPLSLVLLPLDGRHDAQSNDWFADALTAELNAELGRIASAFVISTGTAATFKGKVTDPREVARDLGVRYVVRGTVRRSGDQVRLALEMVDGASGAQHWAQSFDIDRSRLGASVDDVVLQVARSLNVQMYRASGARTAVLDPLQVHADDLAMQGWGIYFRGLSRENFLAAMPLFEQAVARDPRSILGWAGVAVISGLSARIGWTSDRDAAIRRLAAASARLDEVDAEHLYALLARQHVTFLAGDYEGHVLITRATIQRYPNHAPSYSALSNGLMSQGRFDECVELLQRSIRLSPRDPLLGAFHLHLAVCRFMRGEYDEATASARLAVQLGPALPVPPLLLAASLARSGRSDEARAVVAAYLARFPERRATEVVKLMPSPHPVFAAGRARMMESLHALGMP
jgi:DNA-binding winged helix-turn-helix (wHTH) protein/TolB-like protein